MTLLLSFQPAEQATSIKPSVERSGTLGKDEMIITQAHVMGGSALSPARAGLHNVYADLPSVPPNGVTLGFMLALASQAEKKLAANAVSGFIMRAAHITSRFAIHLV